MKHILAKRYKHIGTNDPRIFIDRITIDFKSQYAVIEEEGKYPICLNRNGQRKLYELLKKRFEKK